MDERVQDVYSKGYLKVYEDDPLSACLSLFKEETPPVLAVLDGKDNYKGRPTYSLSTAA
jgi:hypothetical protein